MTPSEFKAWFDGFAEAFDGLPTDRQWKRIKARVAEIDGQPVTERVYIDRYWPSIPRVLPYWSPTPGVPMPVWTSSTNGALLGGQLSRNQNQQASGFNSLQAMADLGRYEASGD